MRSIYLLWGHHPATGRSGLNVAGIVRAGVEVADARGLDAVSMRKVAEHLGVGTMSLYAHVPGKDDLVALMVDAVYAELYGDDLDAAVAQGDWRDGLRFVARRNAELYQRHPWLLDLRPGRPILGPHASRKYETELRVLDGIGLGPIDMDSALTMILGHVEFTARAGRQVVRVQDDTGMTDAQWWAVVAPALEQVMAGEDLSVSGRVGQAVGEQFQAASADAGHALDFGLEVVLDGIQARLDRT